MADPGNFDMEHVLIQWGGLLPGGETFSCSMRTGANTADPISADVPSESSVAAWLQGSIKDAVLAFHTRVGTHIHPAARLTFVKANRINVEGKYMDQSTNEHVFVEAPGGGVNVAVFPNQCTLAISLTTGVKRGPAHRGRFYLPSPSMTVNSTTGLISTADADEIGDSVKTFIEAIADVPGVDAPFSQTPTVFSRQSNVGVLPVRNAGHRKITGVEVGRVVDTQRRRRRSLPEGYRATALDLGAF